MIIEDNIAQVVQLLFNGIATNDTQTISIYCERKKFYEDYEGLPANIIGNLREVPNTYRIAELEGTESVSVTYALELLIPENMCEACKHTFKQMQINTTGTLVDVSSITAFNGYSLALTINGYDEGAELVTERGNLIKAIVYIYADIESGIVNGSEFTFTLTDVTDTANPIVYVLPTSSVVAGEILNTRLGNYKTNGTVSVKAQSHSIALGLSGVLKKTSFCRNVILDGLFNGTNITKKYELTVTTYGSVNYTFPVVPSVPSLNIVPKSGMLWTLTLNYA